MKFTTITSGSKWNTFFDLSQKLKHRLSWVAEQLDPNAETKGKSWAEEKGVYSWNWRKNTHKKASWAKLNARQNRAEQRIQQTWTANQNLNTDRTNKSMGNRWLVMARLGFDLLGGHWGQDRAHETDTGQVWKLGKNSEGRAGVEGKWGWGWVHSYTTEHTLNHPREPINPI